MEAKDNKRK